MSARPDGADTDDPVNFTLQMGEESSLPHIQFTPPRRHTTQTHTPHLTTLFCLVTVTVMFVCQCNNMNIAYSN